MRKACGVEVLLFEIAPKSWKRFCLPQQFRKAKPQGVSSKSDLPLQRQTCILCDKTVLCPPKKRTSDSQQIPPAAVLLHPLRSFRKTSTRPSGSLRMTRRPGRVPPTCLRTAVPKTAIAVFDVGETIPRIHQKHCADLVTLSEAGVE